MASFIGIDLGTTNTVIATYDGSTTLVHKNHGQSDSTPSAVHVLVDGTVNCGAQAVAQGVYRPRDLATNFKQLLGSNSTLHFPSANIDRSPVWASAELLKYVYSFLPAAARQASSRHVVVTVPAAFGHLANAATKEAAQQAGLGVVELLSEPVAAALVIAQQDSASQKVLVYDIGGGTFDVSILSINDGTIDILAQGGVPHLGGTHWDADSVAREVVPWLTAKGVDEDDINVNSVKRLLSRAAETAKLDMSRFIAMESDFAGDSTVRVFADENLLKLPNGDEFDINVDISRATFEEIANASIDQSIQSCRDVLADAGISPSAIHGIVFIGGPTMWPVLRPHVCRELGIPEHPVSVNPLTVVAEGAAIFARASAASFDSDGEATERTSSFKDFPLSLTYPESVAGQNAVVSVTLDVVAAPHADFEIRGGGFATGRVPITLAKDVVVDLLQSGSCRFTVTAYLPDGTESSQEFTITRVLKIGNIPSNRRMYVRVLSADGKRQESIELVKKGDSVPAEGTFRVRTAKALSPDVDEAIEFKVFEGDVVDVLSDNDYVGSIYLHSSQLNGHTLKKGAEMVCKFYMDIGMSAYINVSLPELEMTIKNLFLTSVSAADPMLDWVDVLRKARELQKRILSFVADHPNDKQAPELLPKLAGAIRTLDESNVDTEIVRARGDVASITRSFAIIRHTNLPGALVAALEERIRYLETAYNGKLKEVLTEQEAINITPLKDKGFEAAKASDVQAFDEVEQGLERIKINALWRCEPWLREWLDRYSKPPRSEEVQAKAKEGLTALAGEKVAEASQLLLDCVNIVRREEREAKASGSSVGSTQTKDRDAALDDDIQRMI